MNFFLYINNQKDKGFAVAEEVASYLKANGAHFCLEDTMRELVSDTIYLSKAQFMPLDECIKSSSNAIVIGGDGTILKASKLLYGCDIPIIGINMGKVGYMSELEKNEIEFLSALLSDAERTDNMTVDERMMLSCKVLRNDSEVFSSVCLNEAVVAKGDITRMIHLKLKLDGVTIAEYQCDGLIAATPTGSTAYAMSAGGAIIDPKIECISVVPLSPYLCINSSPIIFSKESVLEITYISERGNSAYVSFDGDESFKLSDGDRVIISNAQHNTKLLRFKKTDFYKLLNTKLADRFSELADKN